MFRHQRVVVRRVLVAGRRIQVTRSERREQRWGGVNNNPSVVVMTYDRLRDHMPFNPRLLQKLRCVPQLQMAPLLRSGA